MIEVLERKAQLRESVGVSSSVNIEVRELLRLVLEPLKDKLDIV